jgi:hypothetical protein
MAIGYRLSAVGYRQELMITEFWLTADSRKLTAGRSSSQKLAGLQGWRLVHCETGLSPFYVTVLVGAFGAVKITGRETIAW